MSKKDETKTDIETIRAFMLLVASAVFGMVGYLIIHLNDDFTMYQIIAGVGAFALLLVLFIFLARHYFKVKNELRRLK